MSATTAISTSQRYARTESMMRFNMTLLAPHASFPFLQRGLQQLRLEDEAAFDDHVLSALDALQNRRVAVMRFADLHGAHGKAVGSGAHEHDVLAIQLLQRIGRDENR